MECYGIVGFGCAGYHGAKALRDSGYTGEIHVFTGENEALFNPMLTTYVAGGRLDEAASFPFGNLGEAAEALNLTVHEGRVEKLHTEQKEVEMADGQRFSFEKILIAAGADAFVPNMEGGDNENVLVMRTLKDSLRLKEFLENGNIRKAVVVGASMTGIKVAEVLLNKGVHCVLNDFAPHIFSLAALDPIAEEIERRVQARGVELAFGAGISCVTEDGGGLIVELTDGSSYPCDLVVLCIGTRAVTGILDEKIEINKGILIDERMQTNVKGIYAAGDCAEGKNIQTGASQIIGLWANAASQGRCAGRNMAGFSDTYEGNIVHNITHFMDMDFISFGDKNLAGETVVYNNPNPELMTAAKVGEEGLICVNILGSYENTGIIKNMMMKRMRGNSTSFDTFMEEKLRQQGFDSAFIKILGGVKE